ncbi:MAG: hypothetical protein U9P72_00785 [Campylobacterota bacterium]|nr:hypothetical protein [Campylobacterota bacterium]
MFDFEKISKVRKKLGFKSREDFATSLSIPFATLRSYETASVENIPHSFFNILQQKFNININYFFKENESMLLDDSIVSINQKNNGRAAGRDFNESNNLLTDLDNVTVSLIIKCISKHGEDDVQDRLYRMSRE